MDQWAARAIAMSPPSEVVPKRRRRLGTIALVAIVAAGAGAILGVGASQVVDRTNTQAACVGTDVVRTALPSVVTVETSSSAGGGNGSGQVIRPDGYVLTNYHVVSGAAGASDGAVAVRYSDGTRSIATIVGLDPTTDLAVIKAADGASGRPVIAIGSSAGLRVGQPVVALGAPLGLTSTVTHGVVSALDRYIPLGVGNGRTAHLIDAIQTDASINPGNSGGALVDCAGRLIGVNSAIITVPNAAGQTGGGSVGLGFAIPVDLADAVAQNLIDHGHANHPTFGLVLSPILDPSSGVPMALFVADVVPDGPAAQSGLQTGDILTRVNGAPATSVSQLEKLALLHNAGDSIPVSYVRAGTPGQTTIVLGQPIPF